MKTLVIFHESFGREKAETERLILKKFPGTEIEYLDYTKEKLRNLKPYDAIVLLGAGRLVARCAFTNVLLRRGEIPVYVPCIYDDFLQKWYCKRTEKVSLTAPMLLKMSETDLSGIYSTGVMPCMPIHQ